MKTQQINQNDFLSILLIINKKLRKYYYFLILYNESLKKFVIFHFKYDTIFVNCSFSHEGFQNIDAINYFKSEEIVKFLNNFKNKDKYYFGSKNGAKIKVVKIFKIFFVNKKT